MKNLTKIKFKENGEFNHFPGNTVVANLYTKQDLMEVVDIIQSRYRELPFIDKFTLTPRNSIHMTVIELLCHENRETEFWSSNLPLDTPLQIHLYRKYMITLLNNLKFFHCWMKKFICV